jgi:hypothetical protein
MDHEVSTKPDFGPRGVAIKAPANFVMPQGSILLFEHGERVAAIHREMREELRMIFDECDTPTIDHTVPEDPHDKRTVQQRVVAKHYQQFNRKIRK